MANDKRHRVTITLLQPLERTVEPGEEPALLWRRVTQHERAQRRSQGKRHEARDGDRDRDGDRELLVELTGAATDECRPNKHRAKYEHDGDHRSGNLPHGANDRLPWVLPVLQHISVRVLN